MDYSQFLLLKEELSLILVIVILFVADLFMSPDAHKNDGKPVLNTMLPVVLLTIHTLITIVPGPMADAFGGMYHNQPIQSIVKSILSIGTLIVFLMAHEWMRRPDTAIKQGEFYILTLSTLLGMYFMISAGHFLMFLSAWKRQVSQWQHWLPSTNTAITLPRQVPNIFSRHCSPADCCYTDYL